MSEKYEVITYEDIAAFNYEVPGTGTIECVEREITLVWEETLEKLFEAYSPEKSYKIHTFDTEKQKNRFINAIDDENEKIIDDVDEEISRKMKFGFDYTSPTYED